MKTALHLYLVRHGETAWSITGQHTGMTDLPLTPHGEQTARDLAPTLSVIRFASVWASPRLRARQTCELAGLGAAARPEPDLAEWDYGDYEALRTAHIRERRPGWSVWRDGCPGGETAQDVALRADRLIDRLQALDGPVALFSHGQFCRVLAARWIGLPAAHGQHLLLDPANIGILGRDAGQPQRPEGRVIALWNAPALALRVR